MAPTRIAPRPRDLLFALLSAAASAHTAFLVVLTWLRPELGFGGVVSLLLLPFLMLLVCFLPVTAVLAAARIGLLTLAPSLRVRGLWLVAILCLLGIAVAAGVVWLAAGWLRDEQLTSSLLFGAAVGGVIAGLKIAGPKPEEAAP